MTNEELERRIKVLEAWAHGEGLRRSALGFVVERMVAEQILAMGPEAGERILTDMVNPYRFSVMVQGAKANDERFKRLVGEAASRHVEDAVEGIRRRVAELRAERLAALDGALPEDPQDPMSDAD